MMGVSFCSIGTGIGGLRRAILTFLWRWERERGVLVGVEDYSVDS